MTDPACPKSMTFGPCGGVGWDHSCEADGRRCPFVGRSVTAWTGSVQRPRTIDLPKIVVDHRPSGERSLDARILDVYADLGVAVLVGDHLDDPEDVDRLETVEQTTASGVATIATLTGRDRSVDDRERLIDGFVAADVRAILCVTGDHPSARVGGHRDVEFRSEGTSLADEVRSRGGSVAVAESPLAPPVEQRPRRLLVKQHAGADVVILNHAGSPIDVIGFATQSRGVGVALPMYAAVPVMTDRESIASLERFPGLTLPDGAAATVGGATDPLTTGIGVAVALARELLADGSIAGVNLSGAVTANGPSARSRVMRSVIERIVDL